MSETLAECLARIDAHHARDRAARIDQSRRHGNDYSTIKAEESTLQENRIQLLALAEFLHNCTVVVGKTKVLRVKGSGSKSTHAFSHKGRFVMPYVTLVWKREGDTKKVVIESLEDLVDWEMAYRSGATQERVARIPHIYLRWGHISFHRSGAAPSLYDTFMDDLVAAFNRAAGDNWKKIIEVTRAEWARVEQNLESLVAAQFDAKGDKERLEFQEKLMHMLGKTRGLIDASPEAIFEIFKLGYDEITQLARFSSRNKADVALVQLEDIVEAQNTIRVKKVMES